MNDKRELLPDVAGSKNTITKSNTQNYGKRKNCNGDQSPTEQNHW